jgi:hypothetical protein
MSLDLTKVIESAVDEVAQAGRVAATEVAQAGRAAVGSLSELVHDVGHETRSFVSEHAPSMPAIPGRARKRSSGMSMLRLLLPVAVLAVVAIVIMRRRRSASPYLPEREQAGERDQEVRAEGAAAS